MRTFRNHLFLLLCTTSFVIIGCSRDTEKENLSDPFIANKIVKAVGAEANAGSLLVKFDTPVSEAMLNDIYQDGVAEIEPLFSMSNGDVQKKKQFGLDRWYAVVPNEGTDINVLSKALAAKSRVSIVEYNGDFLSNCDGDVYPVEDLPVTKSTNAGFNDPLLSDQWHYTNMGTVVSSAVKGADINVKDVWSRLTCGDPEIIVAVVDWGVKYSHPDLKDNMWVNPGEIPGNGIDDDNNGYIDDIYGYNFVRGSAEINWDGSGHGTHCAGTIAAVNNNGKGVAGIAGGSGKKDGCRIMSVQVLDNVSGSGSPRATAKAVEYAADMGASIISCSIGYDYAFSSDNDYIQRQKSAEIDAVHYFESVSNNPAINGGIAIFAAGNDSHNYAHYPGAFVDIISVSAFGPDYMPAPYTNYGPGCNITAPGGNTNLGSKAGVLSTVPSELYSSDWGYMQGTSMACPHVSGVVALGMSYAKQLGRKIDKDEFKRMILASSDDIDQRIGKSTDSKIAKYYHQMGTGAIDAWRLMMHIEGTPTSTAQIGAKQWIDLTSIFGTASVSLTYLSVEVPQETVEALGLQSIKGTADKKYPPIPAEDAYAYVQFGRLYVHPTKIGSGKIKISAVGGGDHVGGGDNPPGGMELTQEISLIARDTNGGNGTGGWL